MPKLSRAEAVALIRDQAARVLANVEAEERASVAVDAGLAVSALAAHHNASRRTSSTTFRAVTEVNPTRDPSKR